MFASHTQDTIPLPFNRPHLVTIQKLSGKDIERSQSEHLRGVVAGHTARGWSAQFQQALAKGIATTADVRQALTDPLMGHDRTTIVKAGVKSWTCTAPNGTPIAVTDDAIDDLDDEALEFLAVEIMRLSKPSLFHEAGAEGEQKNAAGSFTEA